MLSKASYLVSPQSLEPTVGSLEERLLIGPRRLTGAGGAASRENVYALLVDRPEKDAGYAGRREQTGGSSVHLPCSWPLQSPPVPLFGDRF